ncbi:MAG: DUF86 domain-containing protein [Candidatus Omnitrophota bacterium]
MSKRGDIEFLGDIKEAIRRIEEYTGEIDYDKFLKDKKTQDAVVRNLQIIGEAVKNITFDFKKKHTDIEWKKIAGLRDKITHYYFGVNWDIVWNAAKNKLPELFVKVKNILK